jgi:endonuclease/exonuclease/phosphatase family metal-dependent hydrolase
MIKTEEGKVKRLYRLNPFNRLAFTLNCIAVIILLASYLSTIISPAAFWPLAFLGLAYPFLVILNILFILYWTVQYKRELLLSLFAILVGYNYLSAYIQLNLAAKAASNTSIKVLSYNVRLFDLYNWSKNKDTRDHMLTFLKEESADIMCFQEIYNDDNGEFLTLDSLLESQEVTSHHVEYTKKLKQTTKMAFWGIGTFSKYPIIHKGKISFGNNVNNVCIFSDLVIKHDTIRVYNMHLQSIHFAKDDYKFLESIQAEKETEELEGSKKILKRLKRAFVKRSKQVDMVAEHIQNSPYKVIVCGDFNDPPVSYTYKKLSAGLNDNFKEGGNGFGRTYNGTFPSFRIDYILSSPGLPCSKFETLPEYYSDHFPVVSQINITH